MTTTTFTKNWEGNARRVAVIDICKNFANNPTLIIIDHCQIRTTFSLNFRGKFGVVKRVTKKDTDEEFAAKWVKVSGPTKDDVLQEIEIMGKLNHKRLVGLYDAYDVSRNMVLIMEL